MMTTDTIGEAAIAAFTERYRGRPATWDTQDEPVQLRWIRVTALALNGNITSGREFREKYLDGIGAPDRDTDKEWIQISRDDRNSWDDVYDTVQAIGDKARRDARQFMPVPTASKPKRRAPARRKAGPVAVAPPEPMLSTLPPLRDRLIERRKRVA